VRQVGYLSELYKDARFEKYKKKIPQDVLSTQMSRIGTSDNTETKLQFEM